MTYAYDPTHEVDRDTMRPQNVHMDEPHMQWWEQLVADAEYLAWAKTRGLPNRRNERCWRIVAYNSAINACMPKLTDAEFLAGLTTTSAIDRLTPSEYNRYMRLRGFWWYGHGGY